MLSFICLCSTLIRPNISHYISCFTRFFLGYSTFNHPLDDDHKFDFVCIAPISKCQHINIGQPPTYVEKLQEKENALMDSRFVFTQSALHNLTTLLRRTLAIYVYIFIMNIDYIVWKINQLPITKTHIRFSRTDWPYLCAESVAWPHSRSVSYTQTIESRAWFNFPKHQTIESKSNAFLGRQFSTE